MMALGQGASTGQTALPTVGDTVWVAQTVAVPPGATVRPADWDAPDPIERLGPPSVRARGDSAEIAYPIVIWRAGELTIQVPGPLLLGAGGRIDSLPAHPVAVRVGSVLPAVPADSALAPQPRADFVPRTSTSPAPLLVWLGVTLALLAPVHWWWRRRGRPHPRAALPAPGLREPPLDRWADAGESRAVASVATARLRAQIATRMPAAHAGLDTEDVLRAVAGRFDWPLAELGDLLRSLDEARFGHTAFPDTTGLARWAEEMAPRLVAEAA